MFLSLRIIYVERGLNNKIKIIHERALMNVYQDKKYSFETIKTWQIYANSYEKLQYSATELFKVKNDISPEIMK